MVSAFCLLFSAMTLTGNLASTGDFENSSLDGWDLWTREKGVGELRIDFNTKHSGKASAHIIHRGEQDWSFDPGVYFSVSPGDLFTMSCWIKLSGRGTAEISAVLMAGETVIEWMYGTARTAETEEWKLVKTRFAIPRGVDRIRPRVTGTGPAEIRIDDFSVVKEGNLMSDQTAQLPDQMTIDNNLIEITFDLDTKTMSVIDKRKSLRWQQSALQDSFVIRKAEQVNNAIVLDMTEVEALIDLRLTIQIEKTLPEFTVSISSDGKLERPINFPQPFVTDPGTYLVIPMNEGISYPVDDESISPMRLIAYGGHGICMAFWGVTDGDVGHMAIIETPDDAAIRIARSDDGRLCVMPEWESQKGNFGYKRWLRYIFFDSGGHTAICKRYREYAKELGLLKTLKRKRSENSNVDLLVGAVNVWCWDQNPVEIVREMREAGIRQILWSNRGTAKNIRIMNSMGILTGRYDIYQDLMDPANLKYLHGVHPDWTQEGFPDDIMLDENGKPRSGWQVRGKDGKMYACAVLCDKRALEYARKRVPLELKTHPYRARFIDTTTASPWRECYHPDHPMTRSESRHWKMELLRYMSEEMGLVTGSETGHDAAVPYVHYFEGMLSLGPYRVPDAGRDMIRIWDEVPERVARFQVGHQYRLPLWELVYHDCVVAQWYWGDYNNKLPAIWHKRDLFNILYGTPPMFMFTRETWEKNKDRFVESYRNVCSVARKVGYAEMLSHEFLTDDRNVQQTKFANGVVVTVNFGDQPYERCDGVVIEPISYLMEETE